MPKPLRPCGAPGCPVLVAARYCHAHTPQRHKDAAQATFYGSARWQALRALVRAQEPVCRECRAAPTRVVDHRDGDWTNNQRENLRGLCTGCNATITAKQHRAKRG